MKKILLSFTIFLFLFSFSTTYSHAVGTVPYLNCGQAHKSNNQCCWPNEVNSNSLIGDPDNAGIIAKATIGSAVKISKTIFFEWLPGLLNRAFDIGLDTSKSMDNSLTREEIIKREYSNFCETGEPKNKDDLNGDISTLTKQNCVCQAPENSFIGVYGVNDAKNTPLGRKCEKALDPKEKNSCLSCLNNINVTGKASVWTALGCVPLDLPTFISQYVFVTLLGLAGLLSLGCLIYWAFKLETGGASADVQKKAREGIRQCFMGLLLIIFSIFIIRLIGVSILDLPGIK